MKQIEALCEVTMGVRLQVTSRPLLNTFSKCKITLSWERKDQQFSPERVPDFVFLFLHILCEALHFQVLRNKKRNPRWSRRFIGGII